MSSASPILWYFADPMCSWCWGFSPVIRQVKAELGDRLKIALVLGGLSPGRDRPLGQVERDEILHHWREVEKLTGQRFCFAAALPDGFIYDTEPASRAIITFGELNAEDRMAYLQAVQQAFYVENRDVTDARVLAGLATPWCIDQDVFLARFESAQMQQRTGLHFQQARKAGITGFPSLILQTDQGMTRLSDGYIAFDRLKEKLARGLAV